MATADLPASSKPDKGKKERKVYRAGQGGFLEEMGELAVFAGQALRAVPRSFKFTAEIARLNAIITRRTTLLLFIMCAFLGLSASNFIFFFLRSIGASDFAGILPGLVTPRQIAPQMFGYVFAGSVCCGIAAELGAARIQQEIDAYESEGVDPMEILVGTRIIAVMLYVPLAAAVAMLGCYCGSFLLIVIILHGNSGQQLTDTFFSIFPSTSIWFCMITVGLVTLQCVIVACFYGMRNTGGGPDTVGLGVARSLGINLIVLHFVFSLVGLIFYGGSLGIPIGD